MKKLKKNQEKLKHERLIKLIKKAEKEAAKFVEKNERLEENLQIFHTATSQ